MREIVLPTTGDFARMERIKFSDLMACKGEPDLLTALISRLVTIDGRPVDGRYLDEMPLADAFVIAKAINAELEPAGLAKGVS